MAEAFKTKNEKKSNVWAYDMMNEPHDMLASPSWFDIAQPCRDNSLQGFYKN